MAESDNGTANVIQLIIDYNPATGELGVAGPMENPIVFLGMLEMAKAIMVETRARAQRPSIIPGVTPFDPNMLKQH